jgi:Fur family transcriptional regulator, zinc uptake regulator
MDVNQEANGSHSKNPYHDHTVCLSKVLDHARQICTERGVQLTPIRFQVLTLICDSHKAVKAYDLLDKIKPLQPAAKPATIYRALDFLLDQGLIHRIESLNAFFGCDHSGHRHEQLMLICKHCEEVEERPASDVMNMLSQELQLAGFSEYSKTIEIQGICSKCALLNK